MKITIESIADFRLDLKHKIENALHALKWNRQKLAEKYGDHIQNAPYSPSNMTQLVNVWKGKEDVSQKMYDWLLEQIEEQKNEGREW